MNLVTLQEYKENQGIASTKEDVRIDSLITSVSQLVKTYCASNIIDNYSTELVEVITVSWSTSTIQLAELPIVNITSVEERTSPANAYSPLTENSGFYVDEYVGLIRRIEPTGGYKNWAIGPGSVRITYTAGYESTPEDLKLAVYDLITYYLKDEHKARKSLSGSTVENSASSSQRMNVGFPDHIKRVLDLYKLI